MLTTMKKSVLTISAIIAASAVMAQSAEDALRFSQTYQQGTARSAAMGGAFGALGGDVSVLATNPAGMSIYKDGAFSFTPVFGNVTSNNTFNGVESEDDRFSFKLSNIGFVTSHHNGNEGGFSGFAFGMAFNRLNNFNINQKVAGRNDVSSFLDYWTKRSQGVHPDNLNDIYDYRAYDLYLFDEVSQDPYQYQNVYGYPGAGVSSGEYQTYISTAKGGINSWDFAFSGVYAEKVYFGASLGIQSLNYKNVATFKEEDLSNQFSFEDWSFKEEMQYRGSGVNFKAGVIVKPVNFLRFGAAVHTPTYYALHKKVYTRYDACYDNEAPMDPSIPDAYEYDFRFHSPFKGILSGAFIVPNIGLLSVEYEYVDYRKSRIELNEEDNHDFSDVNQDIKDLYQATKNFRVGAEYLAGQVALRAGYAVYGNPYRKVSESIQRQILSAGVGFKGDGFFFDITGTYHLYNSEADLYPSVDPTSIAAPTYKIDNRHLYVMLAFGFNF